VGLAEIHNCTQIQIVSIFGLLIFGVGSNPQISGGVLKDLSKVYHTWEKSFLISFSNIKLRKKDTQYMVYLKKK